MPASWSIYRCSVLSIENGRLEVIGSFPYDHQSDRDPRATVTVQLADLENSRHRFDEARRVAGLGAAHVTRHGGRVDRDTAIRSIYSGLGRRSVTNACQYIFGTTHWGDVVVERSVAEAWARAFDLAVAELPWAELHYRLPEPVRHDIVDKVLAGNEEQMEDGHLPAEFEIDSSWLGDDNWPFLMATHWPILPPGLDLSDYTHTETTFDGENLVWDEPEQAVEDLRRCGADVIRHDELVNRALGPYGIEAVFSTPEPACHTCQTPLPRWTPIHPLPSLTGKECPGCGADQLVPILYGMPTFEDGWPTDRIVGGCLIEPGRPTKACRACGLHLGAHSAWMRSTSTGLEHVRNRPTPTLEAGYARLLTEAVELLGQNLWVEHETVDWMVDIGLISGTWWQSVPGMIVTCSEACAPEVSERPRFSSYRRQQDTWALQTGVKWSRGDWGIVHVASVDDPIGHALVIRADGLTAVTAEPDEADLIPDIQNHLDL